MGFQEGKPLKSLIYGLTHPLQLAKKRPLLFLALVGSGVLFLGISQGWWTFDSVKSMLPFMKN